MRYDMIIIGGGPAGIGMAVEARFAGIPNDKVLILEKGRESCWSIKNHYAENKLVTANYKGYRNVVHDGVMRIPDLSKPATMDYFLESIHENDLNIVYNQNVLSIDKTDDYFTVETAGEKYYSRVCVIAIGILGKPNRPDYKIPRSLGMRIHYDSRISSITDSDVLVVGGGDSSAERAIELHRNNNRVALSYRQREFDRMTDENRQAISLMERSGHLKILRSSNIAKVERSDGKPLVSFEEADHEPLSVDYIFYCLGGSTPAPFLRETGIEMDGNLPVLNDKFETSVPGLFLAGDLTAGTSGGSINWAFATARKSMTYIAENYLSDVAAGA